MKKLQLFIALLTQYVRIKSVSTDDAFKPQILEQVSWLTNLFEKNCFTVKILQGPNTNPVVLAEYHVSDNVETKLVYGHYDVQPANQEEGWKGDPFLLRNEGGSLIARGIVDNKGQNLIHIFNVINLIKEGKLKYNVKFMIEGNEETANPDMTELVAKHAEELKSNSIIISDGEIKGDTPVIEESLRGGGNLTFKIRTADTDLHSGLFGNAIPSASREMALFLTKLVDTNGNVLIPGFYDSVDKIPEAKFAANKLLMEQHDPLLTAPGVKSLIGKYDFYTMTGVWPAVEITGLESGYNGTGYRNAIPSTASAKINFRLVASQSPDEFIRAFKDFAESNLPAYVRHEIGVDKMYMPVKVDVNSLEILKIMQLQENIYGKKPVLINVGGGIPIVDDFKTVLGIDSILLPLGNDTCNMHGLEENFTIDLIEKPLKLSEAIFSA
jgi:acetylornithine deacetylase/succinyl-diaminopimelate desuccinylase-like protein